MVLVGTTEPCDGCVSWRLLIFLLEWVNPIDLSLALHKKQHGFLVAFIFPCGPDKLSGQEGPFMNSKVRASHSDPHCWL